MKSSAIAAESPFCAHYQARRETNEFKSALLTCMRVGITAAMLTLIAGQLLVAAPSKGQSVHDVYVDLNFSGSSLIQMLQGIEKQAPFKFVYRKSELRGMRAQEALTGRFSVAEVLDRMLGDKGLKYEQIERNILIKPSAGQISLNGKNLRLDEALQAIGEQSGLSIYMSPQLLKEAKPVNISLHNTQLRDALDAVFAQQQLTYELTDNRLLVKKENPLNVDENADSEQQNAITGRVRVMLDGMPRAVSGITVRDRASGVQTATDAEGYFRIAAEPGAKLQFSLLGYTTVDINTAKQGEIDVILEPLVNDLEEVVITGYAQQMKREITGSISSVKADEIAGALSTSLDAAMQGRMAGVNVQSRVGIPGAAIKVEVRGTGSITAGTDPVYIVDGIILNTDNASSVLSTNPLANINPDDILSIEVLKDAAAASVYGAQAANGVVLITTKKGRTGAANLSVSYRNGTVTPTNLMELMNTQEYLNARFEAMRNSNPAWTEQQVWTNVLNASRLPNTLTPEEIAELPTYDWQDAAYRTGISNKIDIAVDGGGERNNYRISGAYEDTEGSIVGSDFKRGTVNFNYSNRITSNVEISSNINLSTIRQEGPNGALGSTTQYTAPSYSSPMILPFIPIYLENGEFNADRNGFPGIFTQNPLYSTKVNDLIERNTGVFGNLQLTYDILDNLRYKTIIGIDYRDIGARNYIDPRSQEGFARRGILTEYGENPVSFTNSHILSYSPELGGEHKLTALGGLEYRSFTNQSAMTRGEGFPSFEFRQLQSAAIITDATSSWTGVKRMGSFIQANYTFGNRFMASGIVRYDGSSRFGANNRFGWFPAISAGWDIAQESFIKNKSLINQLKIRVGYGETGNDQIGNFVSRSLYGGGITYNGESGIRANSLGNAGLRWERNATANIGVDFSLLNNRIFGAVEVYQRLSKDLLLNKPVVWAGGFSEIIDNLGEVSNKGLEVELGAHVISSPTFNWRTNFNITFQRNRVEKLYDGELVLPGDQTVRVGYSLRTHVLPQYAGVNAANGKAVWYDGAGNLTYSPPTMTETSFAPYGLPNELPDYYGGFNNEFTYKGISLGVFFQYDFGRVLYNNMNRNMSRKGDLQINGIRWYYDNRWQEPGQITSVSRPRNNAAEVNSSRSDLASTRYLEDASYIRLKNISLGYNIPSELLSAIKVQTAKVFVQANNLVTWTAFTGYDPEFYVTGSNTTSNVGIIPMTRSFFIGVQMGL